MKVYLLALRAYSSWKMKECLTMFSVTSLAISIHVVQRLISMDCLCNQCFEGTGLFTIPYVLHSLCVLQKDSVIQVIRILLLLTKDVIMYGLLKQHDLMSSLFLWSSKSFSLISHFRGHLVLSGPQLATPQLMQVRNFFHLLDIYEDIFSLHVI